MKKYNLTFISDEDLFKHIKEILLLYLQKISFKSISKNSVDPVKLAFDAKIYNKSITEMLEIEMIQQLDDDKISYNTFLHKNIFKYVVNDCDTTGKQFDIVNTKHSIYGLFMDEHKRKDLSFTLNTYMLMQHTILENKQATCILVDAVAEDKLNIPWEVSVDDKLFSNQQIRHMSIEKFYEIMTGDKSVLKNLYMILPEVINDIMIEENINNSAMQEFHKYSDERLKSIFSQT
ncbi:MAG: Eco47II family restriction endonuclease [Victivallaceae bacterium]|nr:Eco47II family restriction endonuclease [Victivallaceae bacterium]